MKQCQLSSEPLKEPQIAELQRRMECQPDEDLCRFMDRVTQLIDKIIFSRGIRVDDPTYPQTRKQWIQILFIQKLDPSYKSWILFHTEPTDSIEWILDVVEKIKTSRDNAQAPQRSEQFLNPIAPVFQQQQSKRSDFQLRNMIDRYRSDLKRQQKILCNRCTYPHHMAQFCMANTYELQESLNKNKNQYSRNFNQNQKNFQGRQFKSNNKEQQRRFNSKRTLAITNEPETDVNTLEIELKDGKQIDNDILYDFNAPIDVKALSSI